MHNENLKDLFKQSKEMMDKKIKSITSGETKETKKKIEKKQKLDNKKEEILNLSDMKYEELYQLAKDKNFKRCSSFNKKDLISFLEKNLGNITTKNEKEKKEIIQKRKEEKRENKREKIKIDLTDIIPYDKQILLSSENSRGYKQLEIIKKKIRDCPSMKEAYIKWANEVIMFEGANK